MKSLSYEAVQRLAPQLIIQSQDSTQGLIPFVLHHDQQRVLEAVLASPRTIILKPRQCGASSILCLHDLLFAWLNPGVQIAIVTHQSSVTSDLLGKCIAWAHQLGITLLKSNTRGITLENGSFIEALTARALSPGAASTLGRGRSYSLVHASEVAHWPRASTHWQALSAAMRVGAHVAFESTAVADEGLFKTTWEAGEGWERLFLSCQSHPQYVKDPSYLTDAEYQRLRDEYGFTSRPHAAFWLHKCRVDNQGDERTHCREYPITQDQAFTYADGRWVTNFTAAPTTTEGQWVIYRAADEPTAMGVDPAEGIGKDHSAIAIVGQRSGQLIATFRRNDVPLIPFVEVIKAAAARWAPVSITVEKNGCGAFVAEAMRQTRHNVLTPAASNTNGEKAARLYRFGAAVMSGAMPIGADLQHECLYSVRTKRGSRWEGPDDLINAVSWAMKWIMENPYKAPVVPLDPATHFIAPTFKKHRRTAASNA